ncbi:MAG: response regulator, partial [Limisphaerales bacterium]
MESKLREHRHRTVEEESSELNSSAKGTSGGPNFRVLHIDDNADDRALVRLELRSEIPQITVVEAAEEAQVEEAMRRGGFDLVITDYELRWTTGLKLLGRIQRAFPETPVIMFTGTGNEEVAVDAMKAGVWDYILKAPEHFKRLRTSVRQALEKSRHSFELSTAEARYKDLFDTVPVGLFRSTPKGEIL